MDEDGTKVLLKPQPKPPLPPNIITPQRIDFEIQQVHEDGPKIGEAYLFNQIQQTQRDDQPPNEIDPLLAVTQKWKETIVGVAKILIDQENSNEDSKEACFIELKDQKLYLYEGISKEFNLIQEFEFPHGSEYRFIENSDEKRLIITDKKRQQISLIIEDNKLYEDILMKWYSTKLFSDFQEKKANQDISKGFNIKNYGFTFNPPSPREFSNLYNDKCMNAYECIENIDSKRQIKNAVDFKHKYRPSRKMTTSELEQMMNGENIFKKDEEIEKHMKEREILQWAPSRDWSRLVMLSQRKLDEETFCLYMEFYDFNCQHDNILHQNRINHISQLLRPQWIQWIEIQYYSFEDCIIKASFISDDHLAVKLSTYRILSIHFSLDSKFSSKTVIELRQAQIEKISELNQIMMIKSDDVYYELKKNNAPSQIEQSQGQDLQLEKDFNKTNIRNIINCGIYDIIIYEDHVKISNNVRPINELVDVPVDSDTLLLLLSKNFIQLFDHQIACLQADLKGIQIIEFTLDYLVKKDRGDQVIQLESPQDDWDFQHCVFDLIKFKEHEYAAIIVTSQKLSGQFYQYYKYQDRRLQLKNQKKLSDYISLQQIPHLPFVTFNCSLFINFDLNHQNNQLELDIKSDESVILHQDLYNIYSEELEVYDSKFKKLFYQFIEAHEQLSLSQNDLIEIPELYTLVNITQQPENSRIFIFSQSLRSIQSIDFPQLRIFRYVTHKVIIQDSRYYLSIILQVNETSFEELRIIFKDDKVVLLPLAFILNLQENEQEFKLHKSYYNDGSTLSLLFNNQNTDTGYCYFMQYQSKFKEIDQKINWIQKKETIKIDKMGLTASIVSYIAVQLNLKESLKLKDSILDEFKSIITKSNSKFKIEQYNESHIIAIQNKFILYEPGKQNISILDNLFSFISLVTLKLNQSPLLIRFNSLNQDPGALEYIDEFNLKFPFPILFPVKKSSQIDENQNKILHQFYDDKLFLMPFSFGLHEGFISNFNIISEKLEFFISRQDWLDQRAFERIELSQKIDSIIDKLSVIKGRKNIEQFINQQDLNELLSFNIYTRQNLITRTKNDQANRDFIYSGLYKRLEDADVDNLPILIYNIASDSRQNENILDILIKNEAIKLVQLIVSIAIKQDQIGYINNQLSQYLYYFNPNDIQIYLDSQIFFFKISKDFYNEYQSLNINFTKPYSNHDSFPEVQNNIQSIENEIFSEMNHPEKSKDKFPVEYYAINLSELKRKDLEIHPCRQPTLILMQEANKDATILERESVQLIIDFKWDSYAQKIFGVQLIFIIFFIVAFIIDIVAVSKNSHLFENNDLKQVIPRIISMAIISLFGVYEFINLMKDIWSYIQSIWNLVDLLFVFIYTTYFIMSFSNPELEYPLKTLQLIIVIFSFIKVSFLIRVWQKISFLVTMLTVVFKELLIFLLYFLIVISALTVMAQIIINKSGDGYKGVSEAANFLIVLRQAIGDYDSSSIIEGASDYKILAWLLWFVILIVGNIVFMNFIIAVVNESYVNCMEKKMKIIYNIKLEMIAEIESILPDQVFKNQEWFPKFLIVRRMLGSNLGEQSLDEWQGFVRQIKRNLDKQTIQLNEFIQSSTKNTKIELKDEMKKEQAKRKKQHAKMKKQQAQMNKEQEDMKNDTAEIKLMLSTLFKDQLEAINAKDLLDKKNKAN